MTDSAADKQSDADLRRKAWLVPLLLFMFFFAYCLFAERALLFGPFMLPTGDNAADDLLIQQAHRLQLLSGNYSRFGFYHPGPFFLYLAAFGEDLFFRWTRLFTSYYGAQTFALSLLHAAALALSCRLWLLVTERAGFALLASVIIAASTVAPVSPGNPFIYAWTPYATTASSLFAATGLAGIILRNSSWLPLLALGCAQMVHGHASFLGIAPLICVLACLASAFLGQWPFNPRRLGAYTCWIRQHRFDFGLSMAVLLIFSVPIVLHTICDWPGEFGRYMRFAGVLPPQKFTSALRTESLFIPVRGLWLVLLLIPAAGADSAASPGLRQQARRLRYASLTLFVSGALPGLWYAWREVDNLANHYLLLWLAPFASTAAIAAIFYALIAGRWKPVLGYSVCLLSVVLSVWTLSEVNPLVPIERSENLSIQLAVSRLLSEPDATNNAKTELFLDLSPAGWMAAWPETVAVLAALKRSRRNSLCISPETWHLLFGVQQRCDLARDHIDRRRIITSWDKIKTRPAIQLGEAGITTSTGPVIGERLSIAHSILVGVALEPGWSGAAPAGIWTDGKAARIGFCTINLPDQFQLILDGTLLTSKSSVWSIQVLDAGVQVGLAQGTTGPVSVRVNVQKKPLRSRMSLTLVIKPAPLRSGMNAARARSRADFMLSGISFLKKRTTPQP